MKQSYDVIIVGAGPAGATLAYELAKRGIGVLLLEKEKLPRYKCCAGGLTGKTVRLLAFDISEVVEDVIHEIRFSFNFGNPYLGQHSQPLIYTVMRDVFDRFLAERAQQLGAVLMDSQKVTQIHINADSVETSTADNVFRSRFVVGADGAYSIVAREVGMKRRIEYFAAIESEVVVPPEELTKWKSRVRIDLGCVPGGYAWVFPKRNHLSIGAGCVASKARPLKHHHRTFLNSLGIGNHTIARSSTHLIPTCRKGEPACQDRVLLLGDAAGLADPLTGEGIYNAVLSAQLAAPAIENCLVRGRVGLQDYQRAMDERIVSELSVARILSKFFVRFPHLAFGLLNRSEGVWRTGCQLMLGETNYAAIKEGKGGFKGILNRLFRA